MAEENAKDHCFSRFSLKFLPQSAFCYALSTGTLCGRSRTGRSPTFLLLYSFFHSPLIFIKFIHVDETQLGSYYNVGWILGLREI
jgi:hypothetical protein